MNSYDDQLYPRVANLKLQNPSLKVKLARLILPLLFLSSFFFATVGQNSFFFFFFFHFADRLSFRFS